MITAVQAAVQWKIYRSFFRYRRISSYTMISWNKTPHAFLLSCWLNYGHSVLWGTAVPIFLFSAVAIVATEAAGMHHRDEKNTIPASEGKLYAAQYEGGIDRYYTSVAIFSSRNHNTVRLRK